MSAFAMLNGDGTELEPHVAEVMHWGLVSCPTGASLTRVAALMADERVHCVVVIDDHSNMGSLWGVISDLDLIAAASVRGLAEQIAGGTAMTPAVTIAPDEQLERAAAVMTRHGVTHLVVVDPVEQRPVGVVSSLDLAAALASADPIDSSTTSTDDTASLYGSGFEGVALAGLTDP